MVDSSCRFDNMGCGKYRYFAEKNKEIGGYLMDTDLENEYRLPGAVFAEERRGKAGFGFE